MEEGGDWMRQWFKEVLQWRPSNVKVVRVTLIRCYGIPCHAWNMEFFESLMAHVVSTYVQMTISHFV